MEAWSLLPAGRRQDEFRTEAGRGQEQLLLLVDGGTDSTSEPEQKVLLPSQVDEEEDVWREQLPQTVCVCVFRLWTEAWSSKCPTLPPSETPR